MLALILSILAVSLGVSLIFINRSSKLAKEIDTDPETPISGHQIQTELEPPQPDLPEENTDSTKKSPEVNFLESNFEIEQLYKDEEKYKKIEAPVSEEIVEEIEKKKKPKKAPPAKKYSKKAKEPKKDEKTKGAKRGRKPKPKDDILLHS